MNGISTRPAWTARLVGLCLVVILALGSASEGFAAPAAPQNTIRTFYGTLLETMKQGPTLGQSGRYARLAPIVQRVFDIPLMARLAVGSPWTTFTPTQQQEVTQAFAHYVTATYADRFDSYSGEQLQVTGERPYGAQVIVTTRIVKSNGEPVTINYLMRDNGGTWQVADVYVDGTISQLATQRSEFYSILRREGVTGLITALNRKVDLLQRSASAT